MNKIPKKVWVPLAVIIAIYAAWSIAYPSGTWRYKMTVTVETPEGIKTGSAVREIYAYREPQILGVARGGHAHLMKGEAVVVDLGKRGVLFALMRGGSGVDYGHQIVFDAFPSPGRAGPLSREGIRYYRSLENAKVTLPSQQYPMFVRFRDPKDPKTVENVLEMNAYMLSPPIKADHTEEMFGAGVRIKKVTIEMTDEPVTVGIVQLLNWLPEYRNKMLDGQRYETINTPNRFANSLGGGDFTAGILHHGQ